MLSFNASELLALLVNLRGSAIHHVGLDVSMLDMAKPLIHVAEDDSRHSLKLLVHLSLCCGFQDLVHTDVKLSPCGLAIF